MIDPTTRHQVAEGIRKFFSSEIPASEFVDHYLLLGVRSPDSGLRRLCQDSAVCFVDWDDRFYDGAEITPQAEHAIRFLHSEEEEWKPML